MFIVTNNHVVEGAKTLTVQFIDDSTAAAEVNLKTGNTSDSALWRTDFGRVIGEGGDTVTKKSGGVREQSACELHTIARVARETDNNIFQLFYIHNV